MTTTFKDAVTITGLLKATAGIEFSQGIENADVGAAAGIVASKLQHQHSIHYSQADGTAVAAAIVPIYTCRGSTATIVAIEVACIDSPSGGDLKFTVDLQQFAAGDALATRLTGVIDYVNATPDGTVLAGTIDTASLVDGDSLAIVVAVAGSTGTQGEGVVVTVTVREDAD